MTEYVYQKKHADGLLYPLSGDQSDFDELDANGVPIVHHASNVLTSMSDEELGLRLSIYKVEVVPPAAPEAPEAPAPAPDTSLIGRPLNEAEQAVLDNLTVFQPTPQRLVIFGGLHMRQYSLAQGQVHQGHKHNFDHVTYLHSGKLLCQVDGCPDTVFEGPIPIAIKAELWHRFTAISDADYSCVFALRDESGEITDVFSGDESPYGWAPTTPDEIKQRLEAGCASCALKATCSSATP